MNHVEQLSPVTDIEAVAIDLSSLLSDPLNADIAVEFPGSVARYTGELEEVVRNLGEAVADCNPGIRQQFVAYSDKRAVGMAVVRFADNVPEGVNSVWPNVSLLICHPYRAQGLGRLSIDASLRAVDQQFGGKAWTEVRKANIASIRLVKSAGFLPINETDEKVAYEYHS